MCFAGCPPMSQMEHRGTLGQQRGRIDPTGDHDYTRGKHGDNGWCWQQCGVILGECMRDHFLPWRNSHTLACDSCCDYYSLHSWKSGKAYRDACSETSHSRDNEMKKLGLALGGGGARGLAHRRDIPRCHEHRSKAILPCSVTGHCASAAGG